MNPLKQGLKHPTHNQGCFHPYCVKEVNPLKQGLKRSFNSNTHRKLEEVKEVNPLKQGLKRHAELSFEIVKPS